MAGQQRVGKQSGGALAVQTRLAPDRLMEHHRRERLVTLVLGAHRYEQDRAAAEPLERVVLNRVGGAYRQRAIARQQLEPRGLVEAVDRRTDTRRRGHEDDGNQQQRERSHPDSFQKKAADALASAVMCPEAIEDQRGGM